LTLLARSHEPLPRLDLLDFANLQKLTVMISPTTYGNHACSPIAWLASEVKAEGWVESQLEQVRILIVLEFETALGQPDAQLLGMVSEALASQARFPKLESVEVVLCLWDRSRQGFIRNEQKGRPYVGNEGVLDTYRRDMEALARRGSPFFVLRWDYHDMSPWTLG
jgi:hypothetical protein